MLPNFIYSNAVAKFLINFEDKNIDFSETLAAKPDEIKYAFNMLRGKVANNSIFD